MVKCVIQLVDPLFSIIVFTQLRLGEAIAAFLCEHFDLLLDQLHEFTSKLLLPLQNTPLSAKRRYLRWEILEGGWHYKAGFRQPYGMYCIEHFWTSCQNLISN